MYICTLWYCVGRQVSVQDVYVKALFYVYFPLVNIYLMTLIIFFQVIHILCFSYPFTPDVHGTLSLSKK